MWHHNRMQAIEFDTNMLPGGQVALPAYYANEIPAGQSVRIIVMWEPQPRRPVEENFDPEDTVDEELLKDLNQR
jgi:hypothetical protein